MVQVPVGPSPIWRCPPGVPGQVVLTWGPSTELVPEGQTLGRHGELVGLGGEGSRVPCRQGGSARVHHHVMAWRETPQCCDPYPAHWEHQGTTGAGFSPQVKESPQYGNPPRD